MMRKEHVLWILALSLMILSACTGQAAAPQLSQASEKIKVVATTSIIADVVGRVGGEFVDLSVLVPIGSDPHSFEPSPQDVALVAKADVVFMNGAGLEEFIQPLIENAGEKARLVSVSEGIQLRKFDPGAAGEEHAGEDLHGSDPHVWMDPNNVIIWVQNIAAALSEVDPAHTASYQANAEKYEQELKAVDAWIQEQVAQIPVENRKIVTDHIVFSYFAARYGFTQVGAVIPGYSTMAEPSAKELAALEDAIRKRGVKAIFVGETVNPALEQRVAEDTGVQLVFIYTGSLTGKDGPAGTYLDFIKYNVNALVSALK